MYYDKQTEVVPEAPAKPLEQWRQDLLAAAQYLREHGWCQYVGLNGKGESCMMGGLYYAVGKNDTRYRAAFGRVQHNLQGRPETWNDHRGRTKEEVIAKLEEIARA